MARDGLKTFMQAGAFFFVAGSVSALFQPRGSGEFVASVCSSGIGLVLIVMALIAARAIKI